MLKKFSVLLGFLCMCVSNPAHATKDNVYFHIVWREQSLKHMLHLVEVVSGAGFSGITLGITKSVCLDFKLWDCRNAVNSQSDLLEIISATKAQRLAIEIEVKLLNKQQKAFNHLEHLLLNQETLDPTLKATYNLYEEFFSYLKNNLMVESLIIGFDEIHGIRPHEREQIHISNEKILLAHDYHHASKLLSGLAEKYNISLSIYGDMLFSNLITECADGPSFHGHLLPGYGDELRKMISKKYTFILYFYFKTENFCSIDLLDIEDRSYSLGIWRPNRTQATLLQNIRERELEVKIYLFNFTDYKKEVKTINDISSYIKKRSALLVKYGFMKQKRLIYEN